MKFQVRDLVINTVDKNKLLSNFKIRNNEYKYRKFKGVFLYR